MSNSQDLHIKAVVFVKETVSTLKKIRNLLCKTLLGCLCCIVWACVLRVGSLRGWGFHVVAFEAMAGILFVFSLKKFILLPIRKKAFSMELVSAELDPGTEAEKVINGYAHRTGTGLDKDAIRKEYAHRIKGSRDEKYEKYECDLVVPWDFGEVGAVLVENENSHEMFLIDILLQGFPKGPVSVTCGSWVHSKSDNREKRIFFTNKSYLPLETPSGLKRRREEELAILRGNGQGERKTFERIYDYDTYNDLGDPDKDKELIRKILGGNKEYPYPRRCRTGRPQSGKDPLIYEKRSSSIYVPRDETFTDVKKESFTIKTAFSILNALLALLPNLETEIEKLFNNGVNSPSPKIESTDRFPSIIAIEKLFKNGVNSPRQLKIESTDIFPSILPMIVKALIYLAYYIFRFDPPAIYEKGKFAWESDEEFSRETLAGINPYSIQLVTEWPLRSKLDPNIYGPPESAITREIIEREIKGFKTVEEALEQKKLFILDYHDLLLPYVNKVREIEGTTLYGSRTLFFLTPNSTLKVLAIELTRPQADKKPQWKRVFTPSCDATACWLWRLAKAHVLAHDSGYHQLVSHWLRTHCCTEPYIIATNRQLSAMHPIYRLLRPHFRYTMEINAYARKDLINAKGIIETTFSPGKYSMELCSEAYKQQWRFDRQALPMDLISRGMAVEDPMAQHGLKLTIEDYPFANDGLILWDNIKEWVTKYVNHYYLDATMVESDKELQEWWREIRTKGHEDKKDETWWPVLNSPQDLISIITTMVWVASGLHASVNFGQYAYAGYFPNRPTIARTNMPTECEDPTEDPTEDKLKSFLDKPEVELLKCFPSQIQAVRVMVILDVLSTHSDDEEYIGKDIEPSWDADPVIKAAFEHFQGKMEKLEETIDARNTEKSNLKNRSGAGVVPYELLKPFSKKSGKTGMGVPNSISI